MHREYVKVRLTDRQRVADNVIEFRFDSPDGSPLPAPSPGDHVEILTPSGMPRCYSATEGPEGSRGGWTVAVALDPAGGGGSASMHAHAQVGDIMDVRPPVGTFPLTTANNALLIAGGIGITPIRSMYNAIRRAGVQYDLVYLAASRPHAAYASEFVDDPHATLHLKNERGGRYDLWEVLREPGERDLFCCGPTALMDQVRALTMHWRPSRLHFENFTGVAPIGDFSGPFTARWAPTGDTFQVPEDATLLNAMLAAGIEWPSSCNAGTCGTCKLTLIHGDADHRDAILTEEEQGNWFTPCVSRGDGLLELGPL
ncbi:PDR/VanB family oxidoreductase [Arthrobacter globiformis]|uniref:PDR/VanB family oxidoreductase n=1 Tax=Arthrobacter globiformis TaxID=1665 RepID=UPI0039791669